jgi:hypothetical protein
VVRGVQVRLAEDIDFKFPMKKACTKEIATFCKDVPHGHARIITCLQVNALLEPDAHRVDLLPDKDLLPDGFCSAV